MLHEKVIYILSHHRLHNHFNLQYVVKFWRYVAIQEIKTDRKWRDFKVAEVKVINSPFNRNSAKLFFSLYTHDCGAMHNFDVAIKLADSKTK